MNSVLRDRSVECINLDESEDSDNECQPPNKMARLDTSQSSSQGSGLALTSLPSPPHSPLTSNLVKTDGRNGFAQIKANSCEKSTVFDGSDENSPTNGWVCDENESRLDLTELNTNTNTNNNSNININISHIIESKTIHSNSHRLEDKSEPKPIKNENNYCFDTKSETLFENKELFLKQLIGLCIEKYCEKQLKCFDTEDNIGNRLKTLRNDSEDRNQKLQQFIESKTKSLNKETQINGRKNSLDSNEEFSLKAKTIEIISTDVQTVTNKPILKEQLIEEINASKVDNSLKPNNGLIKQILDKDLYNKNNCVENGSVDSQQSILQNCLTISSQSSDENVCKTSDNPEVVTIDSDDEEANVSTATMESFVTKNVMNSIYCQSLPQPKLSLSIGPDDKKSFPNGVNGFHQVTLKWSKPDKCQNDWKKISKYLIYMCRHSGTNNNTTSSPIGCVDAMELPMACTLSNLSHGSYEFYIRVKDFCNRVGPSSNIETVNILIT